MPHIHFKNLWQFEITEKTRETIWKYLQLILFSIIGTLLVKISSDDAKEKQVQGALNIGTVLQQMLHKENWFHLGFFE